MGLNSREILVEIKTSWFCLDINVQTKKSRLRSRNSSRCENFGVSRQFVSIEIKKCVDFCIFLSRFLNPSRLFIIFRVKRSWWCQDFSIMLIFLDKSQCVLTNLDNLDASQQSRQKSWLGKVSTEKSWFYKSRPRKKSGLQPSRKSRHLKKWVLTLRTVSILILIGLDCRDPQA